MRAEIDYWLEENAKRRLTGMRKQCLKRQDIHLALIEKGFSISYSSVCKYIQKRKDEKPTETLLRMCAFYGFGYRFCNARAGWASRRVLKGTRFSLLPYHTC